MVAAIIAVGALMLAAGGIVNYKWGLYCYGAEELVRHFAKGRLVADEKGSYTTHINMARLYVERGDDLPPALADNLYQALTVLDRLATSHASAESTSYVKVRDTAFAVADTCTTYLHEAARIHRDAVPDELVAEAATLGRTTTMLGEVALGHVTGHAGRHGTTTIKNTPPQPTKKRPPSPNQN